MSVIYTDKFDKARNFSFFDINDDPNPEELRQFLERLDRACKEGKLQSIIMAAHVRKLSPLNPTLHIFSHCRTKNHAALLLDEIERELRCKIIKLERNES